MASSSNLWRAGAAYRKGDAVQAQQASRQRQRTQQQVPPLSAAERKEVEEAFDLFDADRTGELRAWLPAIPTVVPDRHCILLGHRNCVPQWELFYCVCVWVRGSVKSQRTGPRRRNYFPAVARLCA